MSPADSLQWKQTALFLAKLSLTGCSLLFFSHSLCLFLILLCLSCTMKLERWKQRDVQTEIWRQFNINVTDTLREKPAFRVALWKHLSDNMNKNKCITEVLVKYSFTFNLKPEHFSSICWCCTFRCCLSVQSFQKRSMRIMCVWHKKVKQPFLHCLSSVQS